MAAYGARRPPYPGQPARRRVPLWTADLPALGEAQRLWLEMEAAFVAMGVSPVAAAVALRRGRVSRSFRWDQRGRVLPAGPIQPRVLVRRTGDQALTRERVDQEERLISRFGSCCWLNPGDREVRKVGTGWLMLGGHP
jgi:hypothetical protein